MSLRDVQFHEVHSVIAQGPLSLVRDCVLSGALFYLSEGERDLTNMSVFAGLL